MAIRQIRFIFACPGLKSQDLQRGPLASGHQGRDEQSRLNCCQELLASGYTQGEQLGSGLKSPWFHGAGMKSEINNAVENSEGMKKPAPGLLETVENLLLNKKTALKKPELAEAENAAVQNLPKIDFSDLLDRRVPGFEGRHTVIAANFKLSPDGAADRIPAKKVADLLISAEPGKFLTARMGDDNISIAGSTKSVLLNAPHLENCVSHIANFDSHKFAEVPDMPPAYGPVDPFPAKPGANTITLPREQAPVLEPVPAASPKTPSVADITTREISAHIPVVSHFSTFDTPTTLVKTLELNPNQPAHFVLHDIGGIDQPPTLHPIPGPHEPVSSGGGIGPGQRPSIYEPAVETPVNRQIIARENPSVSISAAGPQPNGREVSGQQQLIYPTTSYESRDNQRVLSQLNSQSETQKQSEQAKPAASNQIAETSPKNIDQQAKSELARKNESNTEPSKPVAELRLAQQEAKPEALRAEQAPKMRTAEDSRPTIEPSTVVRVSVLSSKAGLISELSTPLQNRVPILNDMSRSSLLASAGLTQNPATLDSKGSTAAGTKALSSMGDQGPVSLNSLLNKAPALPTAVNAREFAVNAAAPISGLRSQILLPLAELNLHGQTQSKANDIFLPVVNASTLPPALKPLLAGSTDAASQKNAENITNRAAAVAAVEATKTNALAGVVKPTTKSIDLTSNKKSENNIEVSSADLGSSARRAVGVASQIKEGDRKPAMSAELSGTEEFNTLDGEKRHKEQKPESAFLLALILSLSGLSGRKANQNSEQTTDSTESEKQKKGTQVPSTLQRRVHLVEANDTLQSIAEKYFADARAAWLIADLNAHAIDERNFEEKRVIELKSRQLLDLPEGVEVREFLSTLPKEFDINQKLVTLVTETAVNIEILRQFLGRLMADAPAEEAPTVDFSLPKLTILGVER